MTPSEIAEGRLRAAKIREKLKSGKFKIEFASQDKVDVYDKEVQELLVKIGKYMVDEEDGDPVDWANHCMVTDQSQIGDFMPFDFLGGDPDGIRRRVRESNLQSISQELGFPVSGQDYIWEIAKRMYTMQ